MSHCTNQKKKEVQFRQANRISLPFTHNACIGFTQLTMTTLMSSTNSQLPKISYVKSIDVFLGTCFVMVFAALIEYAAVGYIGKRISMRKNRYQQLVKAAEDKRRKLFIDQQHPNALNELDAHFHHQANSNAPQSNVNMNLTNPNALTSAGQLIDHHNHYSGGDNQQLMMPALHQYVQLSGNNMLSSTTQPSYAAQTGGAAQLPSSSAHPVAHYATIRRNVLERTGSLGCTANATPRLIHRPQVIYIFIYSIQLNAFSNTLSISSNRK